MFRNFYKASQVLAFFTMFSLLGNMVLYTTLGDALALLLLSRVFYVSSALYLLAVLSDLMRPESTPQSIMDNFMAGLKPTLSVVKLLAKTSLPRKKGG